MNVQNSVTLIGHIGKDPSASKVKNGITMATFSLATNETYLKEGEKVTTTQWHNCRIFGKSAEALIKYTKKGSHIGLLGKITYNQYKDKEGITRMATNIEVNDVTFLDKKSEK